MRIMIAGCAGFLGTNLALELLKNKDNEIIGVDDFSTTIDETTNLSKLTHFDKFKFCKFDITNQNTKYFGSFDKIFNLACPASPPRYSAMPIHTLLTCTTGVNNLLEVSEKCKATFIQASTSEVYGDPNEFPQKESYWGNVNSYGPRSNYDNGKRAAEALCYDYRHSYNVDTRIIRIFNTYGPFMDPDDGRVVTNFIKQMLTNQDITIYGDGSQTRSFCYVDDLIDGLIKLSEVNDYDGSPINIGNPNEITIKELIDNLRVIIPDTKSKVTYIDLPKDDPKRRCPDITKAKNILNWEPKVSLLEGLSKTVSYMKEMTNFFDRNWNTSKK